MKRLAPSRPARAAVALAAVARAAVALEKVALAAVAALALAVIAPSGVAHATTQPAVAVMPFKDLSGGSGSVGEAIRETVTTDLKDVPGLRVIERGNIDKILAEQNLQAHKADLDPLSSVKVGKLLGASLIVAGAYQRASANVRLTARFIRVETGEIVGTAKVDGHASELLRLQDRVTSELLRSAGLEQKQVQLFARRPRPKLKSLKTVELYGDAVVEKDEQKRVELLKAALDEDPGFVYASRDLDALEKRLAQYDTANQRETDKVLAQLKAEVANEKDPQKLMLAYTQLFSKLQLQRRWRAVRIVAREVIAHPPPPAPPPYPNLVELAQLYLVQSAQMDRDWDGVLREGEKFLAAYASSNYFTSVRSMIDQAIEKKRAIEDGAKEAKDELDALDPQQKSDACIVGQKYQQHQQLKQARKQFEACLSAGTSRLPRATILLLLATSSLELGDFAACRRWLQQLKEADPKMWKGVSSFELTMPADG